MARKYDAAYVAQYTFLGFFIGLGLVVVTILLQLLAGEGSLSWSFVSQLHRQYPSMYLVDLGPFVCAAFAFLVGRMYSRQRLAMELTAKVAKARYNELLGRRYAGADAPPPARRYSGATRRGDAASAGGQAAELDG